MNDIGRARIELIIVAALAAFFVGFVATKVVVDNVRPIILIPVLLVAAILCLPMCLWRTRWRRRATEATAIVSVLLIIPSFVFFGPLFIFPSALLANMAARQLRQAERLRSSSP